jgi:hypothetical protein
MIGRRAAVGLALACAFAFCAFAAPSAMAINGTTEFTCVKVPAGTGTFADAHCKNLGGGLEYKHEEVKQDETTIVHGTNEKTTAGTTGAEPWILKSSPLGIETEISCAKVTTHGHLTNRLNTVTKEHQIEDAKITQHLTECKVTKPAGCVIPKEEIMIEGMKATTEGQEMNIKFSPEVGTTIVTITFEKCTNPLANGKHEVKGSFRAQAEGTTIVCGHATMTGEKTLEFFGAAAGIQSKDTLSQAEKTEESAKTGNALAPTTVT